MYIFLAKLPLMKKINKFERRGIIKKSKRQYDGYGKENFKMFIVWIKAEYLMHQQEWINKEWRHWKRIIELFFENVIKLLKYSWKLEKINKISQKLEKKLGLSWTSAKHKKV